MFYFHRTALTVVGGSSNTTTLSIPGGMGRQLLIRANTASTVFDASVVDPNGVTVHTEGFSEGEINNRALDLPMDGRYTVHITNATLQDTFTLLLAVEE